MHGFQMLEATDIDLPYQDLAATPEEWKKIFEDTLAYLQRFISSRDPIELLARSATHRLASMFTEQSEPPAAEANIRAQLDKGLEQADVEILQALVLATRPPRRRVPTSPANYERLWPKLSLNVFAFPSSQADHADGNAAAEEAIRRVRLHTTFYRNLFLREYGQYVTRSILKRIDEVSLGRLGYRLTERFEILLSIVDLLDERSATFFSHVTSAWRADGEKSAMREIEYFCSISPLAARAWKLARKRCPTAALKWASIQLSEICFSWPYMLELSELQGRFGLDGVRFLAELAIRPGEIADINIHHVYLNNPVWQRPLIRIDDATLMFPIPGLVSSFPFLIFERFIHADQLVEKAYSTARSTFLEDEIVRLIATAMPSARVYRGVIWQEPGTGKIYENDVVAILGNTIFLFEAKSGRLNDVARRGGYASLIRNLKELYTIPGEQAWRLENYLNLQKEAAVLKIKSSGEEITLNLDRPKVVHKFSICLEHFASMTSTKRLLKSLDLVVNDDAWAPVMSLGELHLVWKFLDSEISFFHYLTRRATIESVFNFIGDEQDLLSVYLTNGLCIDSSDIGDRFVQFHGVDRTIRKERIPRSNRRDCVIHGVPLSPYWAAVVEEVYEQMTLPHRFDIAQVIMNQLPKGLAITEHFVNQWRTRGVLARGKQDIIFSKQTIGLRTFVLGVYLMRGEFDKNEWVERSRTIAFGGASGMLKGSDCVIMAISRKSVEWPFDAISFYRIGKTDELT